MQIAIDGPIATGNGTVSKLAATIEIDTSDMTIEEVLDKIVSFANLAKQKHAKL